MSTISTKSLAQTTEKFSNRILVVSGGGAKGAWGVGKATNLIRRYGRYKVIMGTSTGSMMAPLLLLGDTTGIINLYTSILQKNIFNVNPFKKNKNVSTDKFEDLNWCNVIWKFISGNPTLGETKNLRKFVQEKFLKSYYDQIIRDSLYLGVSVVNMVNGEVSMKSTFDKDMTLDKMCDWIWASANEPLFMSYADDGACADGFYLDGGVRQVIPLQEAVLYAKSHPEYKVIDVIINDYMPVPSSSQNYVETPIFVNDTKWNPWASKWVGRSWIRGLTRLLTIYSASTTSNNINISNLLSKISDLKKGNERNNLEINFYFMNPTTANWYQNELVFDKEKMKKLVEFGKNDAKEIIPTFEKNSLIRKQLSPENEAKALEPLKFVISTENYGPSK